MTDLSALPLWPDTVTASTPTGPAPSAPTPPAAPGATPPQLQRLHPDKPVGQFRTDDLVAFVPQRGWDDPRGRRDRPQLPHRPAVTVRLGPSRRTHPHRPRLAARPTHPHPPPAGVAGPLAHRNSDRRPARHRRPRRLASQRDRSLLMLGLFAGLRCGELNRLRWRNVTSTTPSSRPRQRRPSRDRPSAAAAPRATRRLARDSPRNSMASPATRPSYRCSRRPTVTRPRSRCDNRSRH